MFRGSMVPIVTPFKNGGVDEDGLRRLIEFQIAGGTQAIVPCGTTGESATLSHEEHKRVVELTVDIVGGRVKVIAGSGSNSTGEAVRLTMHAKEAGADAALLITPYYNKPTQEGLYRHFSRIAEEVDIPQILYNVPGRTGVNMLPETVGRLSRLKNIIGIKDATGDIAVASDIVALSEEGFLLISGDDFSTFPMMCLGAVGVISVTANIAPKLLSDMCREFEAGNIDKARGLHYKARELNKVMFCETNPIPVKTALHMMGLIGDEMRLPLCPLSKENEKRLEDVLKGYKLI